MTKQLLKMAFLLLALVGGANSAWAAAVTVFDAAAAGWSADGVNLTTGTTTVGDVTWNGGGSASIASGNATISGVSWTARLKFGGKSTFKSGSTLTRVLTFTPSAAGTVKVYGVHGSSSGTRTFYISQSITSTDRDVTTALGSYACTTENPSGVATATVEKDKMVYIWADNNIGIYGITFEASGPSITTQPQSAVYVTDAAATALTVSATASDGDLSYQWYSNTTGTAAPATDTAIDGATSASYTPSTASAGTTYYYCVVTDSNGSTTSSIATITVSAASAPTISVSGAPVGDVVTGTEVTLSAEMTGVPSPTIQWYSNTTASTSDGTEIVGETSETFSPSTATPGTYYFYAVASNSQGDATSDLATITVVEPEPYATPTITEKNGTVQITSSDDITVSQIKYSLDGGSSWNTYSIPFNLATATTVKAKVVQGEDPSYTDSEVASTDCNAIPAKIDGSFSITLYNDDSNWTKTASQDGSDKIDTWTGKADTYLDGYIIALDNEGKTGSNIKELSTGNAINSKSTIKNSNGRRIKFTIPSGIKVNRITIYSYTNGDSNNKYASTWSFDGETPDMIGLSLRDNDENNGKSESSASNPDIRVFYFDTPLEGSFYLNNSGYQQCFYMVLDYTQTVSATITSSGYASFSSTYALDFSGVEGLEAYIATSGSETTVSMEQVDDAAAGTGLVLKGDAGTYNIPVVASATDYSATNRLWAITSNQNVTAAGTGWTNYVLAKQNDNVVFAPVTGDNSVAVTAGHAALCLANPSGSRAVSMVFGGEATGIDNLTPALSEGEGVVYNLRGQRVAQPTKGLYIVNGKKVVIK